MRRILLTLSPRPCAAALTAGPFAGRVLNVMPTHDDVTIPSAQFRVLLLRRLRMPCSCAAQMQLPRTA